MLLLRRDAFINPPFVRSGCFCWEVPFLATQASVYTDLQQQGFCFLIAGYYGKGGKVLGNY
jgi:hypothetical protein